MLDEEDIYQLLDEKARATVLRLVATHRISLIATEQLQGQLGGILRIASKKVASDLNRLYEASHNLDRLLSVIERQTLMHGVTSRSLRDALSRLCPIFPFC